MKMLVLGAKFSKGNSKIDGQEIDWDKTTITLVVNFSQKQMVDGAVGKDAAYCKFQDADTGRRSISALGVSFPCELDVELSPTQKGFEIASVQKLK